MKVLSHILLYLSILIILNFGYKIDFKKENKFIESNKPKEAKLKITKSNNLADYFLNEKIILENIINNKIQEFDDKSLQESIKLRTDKSPNNNFDNDIQKANDIIKTIDDKSDINNKNNINKILEVINIFKAILIKITPIGLEYSSLTSLISDYKDDNNTEFRFKSLSNNILFDDPPKPYSTDDIPCNSVWLKEKIMDEIYC